MYHKLGLSTHHISCEKQEECVPKRAAVSTFRPKHICALNIPLCGDYHLRRFSCLSLSLSLHVCLQ